MSDIIFLRTVPHTTALASTLDSEQAQQCDALKIVREA